jgi:hypothetical protein
VGVEKVTEISRLELAKACYKEAMLRWISMLGGLLMGHQARSEALFYYFRHHSRQTRPKTPAEFIAREPKCMLIH